MFACSIVLRILFEVNWFHQCNVIMYIKECEHVKMCGTWSSHKGNYWLRGRRRGREGDRKTKGGKKSACFQILIRINVTRITFSLRCTSSYSYIHTHTHQHLHTEMIMSYLWKHQRECNAFSTFYTNKMTIWYATQTM